ncbi:YbaN family protein [Planomicrobium sp. CPCC 101079]|uniref:YbaN family protein n=1 Tax=Planomicrobium sp. CPCC 101079 TaxID=2599618 RepID=UPI0011B79A2A|nr:YbaN family protein [Planomicrobium sp. CPCC 101079]TWT13184.1 DUF454 domain-containing protein [Planomicrobium sp. CPCC 101079]
MKNILFFTLGFLFLGIGLAGVVLPLLPGVPFILLASFCFAKGSKRIDRWFKSTTVYDKYVEGFRQNRGLTLKEKIRINLIADFFILCSVYFVNILIIQVILVLLALVKHYYFIKKIKTIKTKKS